ncbi:hypothetical protein [Rhizobium paranaense]|uniref:Uncharacterized protein n=1 Tax=Rhizobium paranaense TaxID=1650438 RepID=A0A7W9D4P1_9HYPH|nr:hypothetical protein [Rhizobium paranaense]
MRDMLNLEAMEDAGSLSRKMLLVSDAPTGLVNGEHADDELVDNAGGDEFGLGEQDDT